MNTQIDEKFLSDVKQLEQLILNAPYLQTTIEGLLETYLNKVDLTEERFNVLLNSLNNLDDDIAFFKCISFASRQKQLVNTLVKNDIDQNFAIWFWNLSLKYGELFYNSMQKFKEGLDWKEISFRKVTPSPLISNIELTIQRFDDIKLLLECSPISILQLVQICIESFSEYYEDGAILDSEKELISEICNELNALLIDSEHSIPQH
ncbi:hypothetical protein MKX99_21845 [Bacillus sp. FSL R9-9863]|uniref:hypothetical protein n=1 Tax=Bacillus sp. FSL R9-9863 TaxID=2921693 RepID=UPI0030F789FA